MIDLMHTQHISHERFKSLVSIYNILESQGAVVGIAAGSAGRGGYRSGKLYHQRPRDKQDKLPDETSETSETIKIPKSDPMFPLRASS